MNPIGAFAALLIIAPILADTYPRNAKVDALNYAFELTLRDDTDEISGSAVIDLRFQAGVTRVRLDFIGTSPGLESGMKVTAVRSGEGNLEFSHQEDVLLINLGTPTVESERRRIRIDYRGTAATGLIIGENKYGDRTFFSDNWPNKARHWLPTIDHPYDKATCEFIIDAPSHYQVISNGLRVEETDLPDLRRRTHWRQSVPIASWLYVLGVAPFAVQYVDTYQGKSIQTWVYRQDRDAGFYDFAVPTKQALEFFGSRIGPYSYEKLANVQSNSVRGGMEAASAILYSDSAVTGERSERWRNVIIHEVAHQWFGNSVTESDWDDVWLSEGFATYFTLLFVEFAYGRDEFVEGLLSSRERIVEFHEKNPDYRIVHDNLDDMSQVTTGQIYQKGAWTLHMLRGLVGDADFWRGIREYYLRFRDANATTEDFRRVMEETSGRELSGFFQQWLERGSFLKIHGDWGYDHEAKSVTIDLKQVQNDGFLFEMPIQVEISFPDSEKPTVESLALEGARKRFSIPVDGEPSGIVLDPGLWVLMDADFNRENR